MADVRHIEDLLAAVMPDVVTDVTGCTSLLTTGDGLTVLAAPPRVVWVPTLDRFEGPQKRPRGGAVTGRSVATRRAGVALHCWAGSITATEDLVAAVVRSLLAHASGTLDFLAIIDGRWVAAGATTLGEGYLLNITVAIDVTGRAAGASDTPHTARPTHVTTDPSGAQTGDGRLNTGETG